MKNQTQKIKKKQKKLKEAIKTKKLNKKLK